MSPFAESKLRYCVVSVINYMTLAKTRGSQCSLRLSISITFQTLWVDFLNSKMKENKGCLQDLKKSKQMWCAVKNKCLDCCSEWMKTCKDTGSPSVPIWTHTIQTMLTNLSMQCIEGLQQKSLGKRWCTQLLPDKWWILTSCMCSTGWSDFGNLIIKVWADGIFLFYVGNVLVIRLVQLSSLQMFFFPFSPCTNTAIFPTTKQWKFTTHHQTSPRLPQTLA